MDIKQSFSQARKDILNLKLALKASRERAADLVVKEMMERKEPISNPEAGVYVMISNKDKENEEILKVTGISVPRGGDNVIVTGTIDEDVKKKAKQINVSIYDVENPEEILGLLEIIS